MVKTFDELMLAYDREIVLLAFYQRYGKKVCVPHTPTEDDRATSKVSLDLCRHAYNICLKDKTKESIELDIIYGTNEYLDELDKREQDTKTHADGYNLYKKRLCYKYKNDILNYIFGREVHYV